MQSLKDKLQEWIEFDRVQFHIAQKLSIFPEGDWEKIILEEGRKGILWSNHPVGELLSSIMCKMVDEGILLERAGKFRWNNNFEAKE